MTPRVRWRLDKLMIRVHRRTDRPSSVINQRQHERQDKRYDEGQDEEGDKA